MRVPRGYRRNDESPFKGIDTNSSIFELNGMTLDCNIDKNQFYKFQ